MRISVKAVDFETYCQTQNQYDSSNFMQSGQLAKIQVARRNFKKTECLVFQEGETVVGQAVVNYSRHAKFFKQALISNGPLLDYHNTVLVKSVFQVLENYLRGQGVALVKIHPYVMNEVYTESLELVQEGAVQPAIDTVCALGYTRTVDRNENTSTIGQCFYKALDQFVDAPDVYNHFSNVVKRDIKKAEESGVKVRELAISEFDLFYDIVSATVERKNFYVMPKTLLYQLKQEFQDDVKIMLAELDAEAYQSYLLSNIAVLTEKLTNLEEQPQTKKTKGYIRDARDQLNSYEKRLTYFNDKSDNQKFIPMSAYFFIEGPKEVISVAGGSYEEWINFGGATLINWHMITFAKENNKDFNFYGTIETENATKNRGNFNYKRQFGGQLQVLMGSFTKTYNPLLRFVQKIVKR